MIIEPATKRNIDNWMDLVAKARRIEPCSILLALRLK